MHNLLRATAFVAAVLALVASPAYAGGDKSKKNSNSSTQSLTGESFLTSELPANPGTLVVEGTCNPLGEATFTFTATGLASGPYPGTFTESGTVVVTGTSIRAVSFEASFSIDSPAGTVTGTKSLAGFADSSIALCGAAAFPVGGLSAMRFEGTVGYTASIVTAAGTATDTGTAFVNMGDAQVRGVPGFNGFIFSETFTSSSVEPDCEDDNDEQGDDPSCDEDEQ